MATERPVLVQFEAGPVQCAIGEGGRLVGDAQVAAAMATVVLVGMALLRLLGLFTALFNDLDVVVEDSGNDGDHVGFDDACPDGLGAPDADVDDALEGQVPFPHVHHIFAATLLEDADEALDAAIDGEDVPDAGGGGCEVGQMVEGVDEREGGGAVECTAVVEGGGDAHRRLVDVGDAEVDFPHGRMRFPMTHAGASTAGSRREGVSMENEG